MKTTLLCRQDELVTAFREALGRAQRVDIAVAWATPCDPLSYLCDFAKGGGELRAVIGRSFAGTDPRAVRHLIKHATAEVKWAWSPPFSGTFHPKVFIFHHVDSKTAIVGSANLTRGAFLYNTEASVLMSGGAESLDEFGDLLAFFEQQWDSGEEVDEDNLADYESLWAAHPKAGDIPVGDSSEASFEEANVQADRIASRVLSWDWDEYVHQIHRLDKLWQPFGHTIASYLDMLEEVPALTRYLLSSLSKTERLALYGISSEEYPGAGWLGCMSGAGDSRHRLVESDRASKAAQAAMSSALDLLPRDTRSLPSIAAVGRAYAELRDMPGVGTAIATRYLTLRRPDALVSVNNASQDGLSVIFGVPVARLRQWKGYEAAISRLWQSPWMQAPKPSTELEAKFWTYRAALLDAFVYRPASGEHPDETFE